MKYNWRKTERDIDVFLAEELSMNEHFFNWFYENATGNARNYVPQHAKVSVSDADGESDLIVYAKNTETAELHGLYVEDKINARLMNNQAKRYYKRGDSAVSRNEISSYTVVLCAPRTYIETHYKTSGFEHYVCYESIAEYLSIQNDKRSQYRSSFISSTAATAKHTNPRIDDRPTNLIWDAIYEIADTKFRALELEKPTVTKDSFWIRLRPSGIPKRIGIDLKGNQGYVDLTFDKVPREVLYRFASGTLQHDMTIAEAGESSVVRLLTPKLKAGTINQDIRNDIIDVLEKCNRLLIYFKSNEALLLKPHAWIDSDSDA